MLGKYAQDKGYKKAFLLAPNYQAGKDMIGGFKKHFKGEIADEVYTPLGQLDFSAELAKIASAKPDAFFVFMPGGMGVNLVKQFRQAGLETIPFLSVFTVDESTLPAQQDAAVGFYSGMTWAPDTDTPENKRFVAEFEKEYGYVPGSYAMQAYDAAQLIGSAVKAVGGQLADKDALRAALKRPISSPCAGLSSSPIMVFPCRIFTSCGSPSAPTANSRPRSWRRCSPMLSTATPAIVR